MPFPSFAALFARRKQETALDLRELLGKRLDGHDVPDDHIVEAASLLGMDGDAVDELFKQLAHRRELRKIAGQRPALEKELEGATRQRRELEAEFEKVRDAHLEKLRPIAERIREIGERQSQAIVADTELMDLRGLAPDLAARLREAREKRGPLKVAAPRVQDALHGAREEARRLGKILKDEGVDVSAVKELQRGGKLTDRGFMALKGMADRRDMFQAATLYLEHVDRIPELEKEYRDLIAALEPIEAEVLALEREAWHS